MSSTVLDIGKKTKRLSFVPSTQLKKSNITDTNQSPLKQLKCPSLGEWIYKRRHVLEYSTTGKTSESELCVSSQINLKYVVALDSFHGCFLGNWN